MRKSQLNGILDNGLQFLMTEKEEKKEKNKEENTEISEEKAEQSGFPDDVDFKRFLGCGG